jgi:hypothetical protein
MRTINVKKILEIMAGMARNILLLISILALITLLFWVFGGSYFDRFDNYASESYRKHYDSRLAYAKQILSENEPKGIAAIETLMADLESIRSQDRLDPIKREGLELLAKTYEKRGQYDKAIYWADKWSTFDEKDLYGQVYKALLMYHAGIDLFTSLYKKTPEAEAVTETYIKMLAEQKEYKKALSAGQLLSRFQEKLMLNEWEVSCTAADYFSPSEGQKITPQFQKDRTLILSFDIPPGSRKLRIDPPYFSQLFIVHPKISIRCEQKQTDINLWEIPLWFSDMCQENETLKIIADNDPYFYWDIPEEQTKCSVVFRAEIHQNNKALALLFSLADSKSIEENLVSIGEMELAKDVERIKLDILASSSIELFWREKSVVLFDELHKRSAFTEGKKTGDMITFDIEFSVNDNATSLRIDLPDVLGAEYTLDKFEYTSSKQTYEVDLNKIPLTQYNQTKKQQNQFVVVGIDPHFVFELPSGKTSVTSVRLHGTAR